MSMPGEKISTITINIFFHHFFFHTAEPKVQKATLGDRFFYFYFFLPFFSPTGGLTKN